MCYVVWINKIDDGTIFHIAKKNFKIDTAPAVPFDSETCLPMVPAINASIINEIRAAGRDVVSNLSHLSQGATREEIEELCRNVIKVDDDNKPAPKNAAPPQVAPPIDGTWEKPMYCNHCANPNFLDTAGRFKNHRWDQIADYNEFGLFRMCFPEDYIRDVVIPTTNKDLGKKMTLQEFYVWLGCMFFMACYEGVPNWELWWSTKAIDMFDGAPFQLNAFMTKKCFLKITYAIQYTNKAAPLLFTNKFHEVRQMIKEFNKHYKTEYTPSWLNCIDKSMNLWMNKFCPGFMTLPRRRQRQCWNFGRTWQ
jgi:hypothetical protein